MKAMILAAGLGTRLKPWTLNHPKALVPVGGVPMLEHVILNLKNQGFDRIVVNVHHFSDQIIEFLKAKDFGFNILISDENDRLLDTGGALVYARELLKPEEGPILVHNVDILSDADLAGLMKTHVVNNNDSTLLVSDRASSRKLIFDSDMELRGWHHLEENRYRPQEFKAQSTDHEFAFSGIHVIGAKAISDMERIMGENKFSIIDYFLSPERKCRIKGVLQPGLHLLDIGKPATLSQAHKFI